MSTDTKFGTIEFIPSGKDGASVAPCEIDKLAISGRGELLVLSVFADTVQIKAIRSILVGGAKALAQAGGCQVNQPGKESWYAHSPGRLLPTTQDGYKLYTHKLGYGMAHALFITRMPGFMTVVTEEALWQELKTTRFTTPILREWVPYIERELRDSRYLEDAHVFGGCKCGILSANTANLDKIVSDGLAQYSLVIPKPTPVVVTVPATPEQVASVA